MQIRAGVVTPLLRLFGLKQHSRATIKLRYGLKDPGWVRPAARAFLLALKPAGRFCHKAKHHSKQTTCKIQGWGWTQHCGTKQSWDASQPAILLLALDIRVDIYDMRRNIGVSYFEFVTSKLAGEAEEVR